MDILKLRNYYSSDAVLITRHAAERSRQRGIIARDIKCAVMNGEIIESYPDDFPFPSCLILGRTPDNVPIHVCMSDEGTSGRIITAYFPSPEKWRAGFRARKESCGE